MEGGEREEQRAQDGNTESSSMVQTTLGGMRKEERRGSSGTVQNRTLCRKAPSRGTQTSRAREAVLLNEFGEVCKGS